MSINTLTCYLLSVAVVVVIGTYCYGGKETKEVNKLKTLILSGGEMEYIYGVKEMSVRLSEDEMIKVANHIQSFILSSTQLDDACESDQISKTIHQFSVQFGINVHPDRSGSVSQRAFIFVQMAYGVNLASIDNDGDVVNQEKYEKVIVELMKACMGPMQYKQNRVDTMIAQLVKENKHITEYMLNAIAEVTSSRPILEAVLERSSSPETKKTVSEKLLAIGGNQTYSSGKQLQIDHELDKKYLRGEAMGKTMFEVYHE